MRPELAFASITELAAALRGGDVTSTELVQGFIERIRATVGSPPNQKLPAPAGLKGMMGNQAGKLPHTLALHPPRSTPPHRPAITAARIAVLKKNPTAG